MSSIRPPAPPAPIPKGLPQAGEVLDGKFEIEELIGHGSAGVVVAARHVLLNQRVAIKFLRASQNAEASERLVREARALGSIRSEHVARVIDVGQLPNGAPYMVMEYLRGTHLGRLLEARGRLPPSEAVDCILQAGEAVAEAHALGIVHRDLKPANLYVIARPDRSLSVKLLDFGLSKVDDDVDGRLTQTGTIAGEPEYMAPEQMMSLKNADVRSDIWSMGVVLYCLLAGKKPFEGKSLAYVYAAVNKGPPASLSQAFPDIPAGLEAVVLRCLQREPDKRIQSMHELAQALAPFASSRGQTSVTRIVRVGTGKSLHGA
jgi:serine/threonine-protein kinase